MPALRGTGSIDGPRESLLIKLALMLVRGYQLFLSPVLHLIGGGGCRFHPTCSAYAMEALRKHGALRGTRRALSRVLRCHPFHPGGFDPP